MSKVAIEIDSKWVKIVRSPIYWVVAAFQGIALSFAPMFLYRSGKQEFFHGYEWIVVPSCFAVIYLVGLFYMILGGAVITELRKIPSR
jgi:hypothetical protein